MDEIIKNSGFKVRHRSFCVFPLVPKLASKLGISSYNNFVLTLFDSMLSYLFSWNVKYHRTKLWENLGPASIYYVLEK